MPGEIQCVNTERAELGSVIPLKMPFSLNIYITTFCDFKCNYCFHTLEQDKMVEKYGLMMNMSFQTFKKIIDGAMQFPEKLKSIVISGHGEPLVNPELTHMVAYAAEKKIAERIELITNAHLLSHKKSDLLIKNGLTKLRVSLQGVSAKKYEEISNVKIDFNAFVEQLNYFYKKKQGYDCSVYCKTVDAALDIGDEKRFYEIFGECCDMINIEHVVRFEDDVEYKGLHNIDKNKNKNGISIDDVKVCPIPFYSLDIFSDGTITNCHLKRKSTIANVQSMSVYDAWNSDMTKCYWNKLLDFSDDLDCSSCHFKMGLLKPGDNIDSYVEELKNKLRCEAFTNEIE